MTRLRSTTYLMLAFSMAFIACSNHMPIDSSLSSESDKTQTITSGKKVPINRDGKLIYSFRSGTNPFINSIESFLNLYSPSELERVRFFVLRNRNSGTGEILALHTTKGIERLPNLVHLEISSSGIDSLDGIDQLEFLRVVDFLNNKLTEVRGISGLKDLRALNLTGNPIRSVFAIDPSDSLKSLFLERTLIQDLDGIERFPNLVSITAASNKFVDITAISSLEHLRGLEIISNRNNLNEPSIELLNRLKEMDPSKYLAW